jgi:hypothetical protein
MRTNDVGKVGVVVGAEAMIEKDELKGAAKGEVIEREGRA